jgi:hypothetical protein
MSWDQKEFDKQQKRLPPVWRLGYAPDWGFMVARQGNTRTRGEAHRSGEFYSTAKACVDKFLASSDAKPYFPDEIWRVSEGVKYVDPYRIEFFPSATDMSECPNCKTSCPFDYESPLFVGCTEAINEPSILAVVKLKPNATAQSWTEIWRCSCGWQYKLENANG